MQVDFYYLALLTASNMFNACRLYFTNLEFYFLSMKTLIMRRTTTKSAVNFGSIYQKSMKSQLKQIGSNLAALRKARNEEIGTVANAVELAPGVLEQIEIGSCDFQLKTLFALCDYYYTDLESVVGKGELLSIRLN
jgi:hypothetical protein